ncbi:MAG TPA: vWA domain-containing protein [Spirochaetota bacterium]|nr:vWA domain-containing protein [Spirochaetota bacterium]HPI89224.1 vWA domain-containing protein [Spirochaetota bacterium]HPR48959.1 vWA domain-containing protein [Spirochaetota bacterium]
MDSSAQQSLDFFEYWDSFGFFDAIQVVLPPDFMVLFDIARIIFSHDVTSEAYQAIEEISKEDIILEPDRDESIQVNRIEKVSPLSDKMEIDTYRTIHEIKKALPRELAQEDAVFDIKLFTKSLLVQKFFESESDSFKPVSTSQDESGKDAQRFEQKFYLLLDRSPSMELKMRSFYAKCIVAEFLRRKMKSKSKIFYRPFDSTPGKLFKVQKPEDYPVLIERILLTTTGGKSTNLQEAVFQAISDINYEKESTKSEILVVTDGISKIEKNKLKVKLGDIKLNVLKIGSDLGEPDFYDMQEYMRNENIDFDFTTLNMKDVRKELQEHRETQEKDKTNGTRDVSLSRQRILRYIYDYSDNMFKDLKYVSHRFIEIKDLEGGGLFKINDEDTENISRWVSQVEGIAISELDSESKKRLYKQVYFLAQYVQMLLDHGNEGNETLLHSREKLQLVKQRLLSDPELMFTVIQVNELDEDKKLMKLARKEARKMMKEMKLNEKRLSIKQMKKAKVVFTMDVGEGSMGQFLLLMVIKLLQLIKKILLFPFSIFRKKEKPEKNQFRNDLH